MPAASVSIAQRAPTSGTPVASTTMSSGRAPISSTPPMATDSPFSIAWAALSASCAEDGRDAGLAERILGALPLDVEDGREGDAGHLE